MKKNSFILLLLVSFSVYSEGYFLEVQYQSQTETMDCWAACIAMVANYYQHNSAVDWINVGDVKAKGPAGWQSDGITLNDFIPILNSYNIEAIASTSTPTKENIVTALSNKKPTLLINTVYPTVWKHTTVCIAYDDFLDEFDWNDPGSGQRWGNYDQLLTNQGINDENAGSIGMLNPPVDDGDGDGGSEPPSCYADALSKKMFKNPVDVER